jgi:hypothetical protein
MALVSLFIFFPLLAGCADFFLLEIAQTKLSTTMDAIYSYAYNNPANATNVTDLATILTSENQHTTALITFPDGKTTGTSYAPTVSYLCTLTANPAIQSQSTTPCSSNYTQETIVKYQIATKLTLPVPFPFGLTSPFTLSESGQAEIN